MGIAGGRRGRLREVRAVVGVVRVVGVALHVSIAAEYPRGGVGSRTGEVVFE